MPATVATLAVGLTVETGKFFGQLDSALNRAGKKFTAVGKSLSVAVTAPIVAIGAGAIKAAISFESAFAGVIKTVDEATDASGELTAAGIELRGMFRDLAKEIPIPVEQLALIGELAGQLGVPLNQIEDFTKNIAKLSVATNLTVESAATEIARFQNITGKSDEPIDRLAATIVHLGNNLATTEAELLTFSLRIAGAGDIVGLSQAQILAFGGALSSVGINAQAGGTAISKVFVDMANAVASTTGEVIDNTDAIADQTEKMGFLEREVSMAEQAYHAANAELIEARKWWEEGSAQLNKFQVRVDKATLALDKKKVKLREAREALDDLHASHGKIVEDTGKLEQLAKVAGMTGEDFKKAFEEDAAKAMVEFVKGLQRVEESGGNVFEVLEELGFSEIRTRDALLRLAGAGPLLEEALDLAAEGWEENNALTKEAEQRFKTTAAQLQLLKNQVKDVGITVGNVLLPMILDLVEQVRPLIERFSEWAEANPELIRQIALFAAGLAVVGPILLVVGGVLSTIATVIGFLFSPIGLLVAAVAALGVAFVTNFMGIRDWAIEAWEALQPFLEDARGLIEELMGIFSDISTGEITFGEGIGVALNKIQDVITGWIAKVQPIIRAKLAEWGKLFWAWIDDKAIPFAKEKLTAILDIIGKWVAKTIPVIKAKLLEWGKVFWDWIKEEVIPRAQEKLWEIADTFRAWAESGETQTTLFEVGKTLGTLLVDGLKALVGSVAEIAPVIASLAATLVASAVSEFAPAVDAIVSALVGGIIEGVAEGLGIELPPMLSKVLTEVATFVIFPWGKVFEGMEVVDEIISELRDILLSKFQQISDFVHETLVPAFTEIVDFLSVRITGAITTGQATWDSFLETLNTVWSWIDAHIVPVFEAIGEVLNAVVDVALTASAGFWENVLQPALATVWSFIQDKVIPILALLGIGIAKEVGEKSSKLAELWQDVLKPALEIVWGFIQDKVIPILEILASGFETLASVVRDTAGEALEWLKTTVLDAILGALESVESILGRVAEKLREFAESIRAVSLPNWLTPGSATPFEEALRGIGAALLELVPTFALFQAALSLIVNIGNTVFEGLIAGIRLLSEAWQLFVVEITEGWTLLMEMLQLTWTMFIELLNLSWLTFSTYLLTESWPLLESEWTTLTALMQKLWEIAMAAMTKAFEAFLAIVLKGIQQMVAAWNELKSAVEAVTSAVEAVASAVEAVKEAIKKMTSQEIRNRIQKLIDKFDALAAAAEAAAAAMAEAGAGGGGAAETTTGPGLQSGLWRAAQRMFAILDPDETVLPAGIANAFRSAVAAFAQMSESGHAEYGPTYNFDMTVNTNAPTSTVIEDFDLMRAMAGAA